MMFSINTLGEFKGFLREMEKRLTVLEDFKRYTENKEEYLKLLEQYQKYRYGSSPSWEYHTNGLLTSYHYPDFYDAKRFKEEILNPLIVDYHEKQCGKNRGKK